MHCLFTLEYTLKIYRKTKNLYNFHHDNSTQGKTARTLAHSITLCCNIVHYITPLHDIYNYSISDDM